MDLFSKSPPKDILTEQLRDALGIVKTRVVIFLVAIGILILIRKVTFLLIPNSAFLLFGSYLAISFLVWCILKKWKDDPKARIILDIGTGYFLVEIVLNLFIIYYLSPIFIYLFGSSIWLAFFLYTFYSSAGVGGLTGYSYSRGYVNASFILSCLCCGIVFFWEYLGAVPSYQSLPFLTGFFYQKAISSLILFIGLISVFGATRGFSGEIWKKFKRVNQLLEQKTGELEKLTGELEGRVKERTQELEGAKTSLEIRIKARTQELEKLAKSLDEQVKKRTGDLQERINELEDFRRLTVGRELKMIEIEKEIDELKKELGKYKNLAKPEP